MTNGTFDDQEIFQMVTMLNLDEIDELFQSKKAVKVSIRIYPYVQF